MSPRVGLMAAVLGAATWLLGSASAAEAHATLVGTSPASGAVLESPPGEVTVSFSGKLVTAEGDPVQVFSPTGERVDDRHPQVSVGSFRRSESTVSVGLRPANLEVGTYQVMYRVISADTHLVTGNFSFRIESAGRGQSAVPLAGDTAEAAPARDQGLDGTALLTVLMVPIAALVALGSSVFGWLWRRWETGDRD